MKYLIVEDNFVARRLLQKLLSDYGDGDVAVNGIECLYAFKEALDEGKPYDLICLDIMMPQMGGREALKAIRQIESEHGIGGLEGVKVIMTTALGDSENVMKSFREGCEAYIVKPIEKQKLLKEIEGVGLISTTIQ